MLNKRTRPQPEFEFDLMGMKWGEKSLAESRDHCESIKNVNNRITIKI
jgi:hypothetical protein